MTLNWLRAVPAMVVCLMATWAVAGPGEVLHLDITVDGPEAPDIMDLPKSVEFGVGFGYAHVSIGGSDSALDSENMLRIEPYMEAALFDRVPQLRLGFACGVGLDFSDTSGVIISGDNGTFVAASSDIPLWLLEPELRVSWRQYLSDKREWFIEPGAAVGMVYASLNVNDENGKSFDESDTSVTGRVFLNIGRHAGVGAGGLQLSYMRGDSLHLADNVNGDIEEFYIGFFGAIRF